MRPSALPLAMTAILLLSCDKQPEPVNPPDPTAAAADSGAADGGDVTDTAGGEDGGATAAWADMSFEQKKEHMMNVVTPQMHEVFKGFNAERYGEFDCTTCHGPGAKEGKFQMPSPTLPKLPANGAFEPIMKAKPEVMKFMSEAVVPAMAKTLDMPPYDPQTNQGFGCYGCHQSQ